MDAQDSLYALEDEDRGLLDAVAADTPPSPDASPVPDLPETAITEPPAPYIGEGPAAPVDLDAIATQAAPVPPEVGPGATKMPKDASLSPAAIDKQATLDKETATINAATAERTAQEAQHADENDRLAYADYLERRKAGEDALANATKAAQKAELVDPRSKTPGWRSALAVIFGGLGAGLSAAGGGDATNRGLQTLTKKWDDDLELQKANIGRLKDNVAMARTGLRDMDDARQAMRTEANARTLGRYNLAIKQGEAQLRKLGVPAADIAADQRLAALRAARAKVEAQAIKDNDEHNLAVAKAKWYGSKSQRNAKGGGAAGAARAGATADASADVTQYLIDHPGDVPGAQRLAGNLAREGKLKDPAKVVRDANTATKETESQATSAQQGKAGLRAVDEIRKLNYVPTREDIQRWMTNQRVVYAAEGGGAKGAIFTGLQFIPGVPQSEVEGLSPDAQQYFANVRRLMEPLARAKSGAAISATEWTNFYNQYGPNSKGGLAAAEAELRDRFKISGVAGRKIDGSAAPEGGGKPAKAERPQMSDDEKLTEAKAAIKKDSGATDAQKRNAAAYIKSRTNGKSVLRL